MASIGNVAAALYHAQQGTNTGSSSSATGTGSSPSSSSNSPTPASDPLANQSTFLQLLVAQLKNQNPMNPMDGTTFVTQLAQFSDLEQNLAMRQDLDAIDNKYTGSSSIPSTAQASSGSQQTSQSTATNQTSQSNPTAGVSNSNQTGLF